METGLSHIDWQGNAHMVDPGAKPVTKRVAMAQALGVMNQNTLNLF